MISGIDLHEPIHQNIRTSLRPVQARTTPSTFLIPEEYYEKMRKRMLEFGTSSVAIYLRYLLKKYKMKVFQEGFKKSEKVKTQYQEPGQGLVRVSVRSENNDWIVLSEISLGLGFSRCLVFILLLELDLKSDENVGTPTPRYKRDGRIIPYAIVITLIVHPSGNNYRKKLRIHEFSRLRDPIVRQKPHLYYKDGSLNYEALKKGTLNSQSKS